MPSPATSNNFIELKEANSSDQQSLIQEEDQSNAGEKKAKESSFAKGLGLGWLGGTSLTAAIGGLIWWTSSKKTSESTNTTSTTDATTSITTSSETTSTTSSNTTDSTSGTTSTTGTSETTSSTVTTGVTTTGTTGNITTGNGTSSTSTTGTSTTGSTTGNHSNCVEPTAPQTFTYQNPYGGGIEICVVNNDGSAIQLKEWSYESNSKRMGSPWGTAATSTATYTEAKNANNTNYVTTVTYSTPLTVSSHSAVCLTYGYETDPELAKNEIPDVVMPPTSVKIKLNNSSASKSIPINNRQICATDPVPSCDRRAFYTNWSMYGSQYPVTSVPVPAVNEISYFAFLIDTATGKLTSTDAYADSLQMPKLDIMSQQFPNLFKKSLTIGGYNSNSMFYAVASDQTLTNNFANSLKNTLDQFRMKSVIIDWEWGVGESFNNDLFINFFTTIRNVLGPDYQIHLAAPANPQIVNQFSISQWNIISNTLNKILIMTYDYFGWGDYSGELAPLKIDPRSPFSQNYPSNQLSVEGSVNAYKAVGIPAEKIGIGGALYYRAQKVSTMGNTHGLWQPWTGIPSGQFDTTGTYTAKCVLKGQCAPGTALPSDTVYIPTDQNPYGNYTQQPLVYSNSEHIYAGGEDGIAIRAKVQYVAQNHLGGGLMYWEPSQDLNANDPDSLMRAGFDEAQRLFGTTTKRAETKYAHPFAEQADLAPEFRTKGEADFSTHEQGELQKALHELFSNFPTELFKAFCSAVAQSTLYSFLSMISEEYLTNYLKAHKWDDENIYWANQAVKILTLLLIGNVKTAAVTQGLHHALVFSGVSEQTAQQASLAASFAINAAATSGVVPVIVASTAVGIGTQIARGGMFAIKNAQKEIANQSTLLTEEDLQQAQRIEAIQNLMV